MPSKNPAQRLKDILESIDAIRTFTEGSSNHLRRHAGAGDHFRSSAPLAGRHKDQLSGIDWQAVAAAGNVYRHEYEVVDDALIWHTVQHGLSELRDMSEAELLRSDAADH